MIRNRVVLWIILILVVLDFTSYLIRRLPSHRIRNQPALCDGLQKLIDVAPLQLFPELLLKALLELLECAGSLQGFKKKKLLRPRVKVAGVSRVLNHEFVRTEIAQYNPRIQLRQ